MSLRLSLMVKGSAALVAALVLIALFIPVDRNNPPVESALKAPVAIQKMLVSACYDCHSFETRWPWYSRIAPVSWLVASHVKEGRKDLNFSRWPTYNFQEQDLILREMEKQISERIMPPKGYEVLHPEARLNTRQREDLLGWIRQGIIADDELNF